MKYGVLVKDFNDSVDIWGFNFPYEGLKAGHLFEWTGKNSMPDYSGLFVSEGNYIPMSIAAEISESEYIRLKALQEPEYTERTMQQLEDELGYKVKIIKGEE
tara:strand:+ start:2300 stop:2605 length:306 start_codon:yes stop_codon:yes gene_type:complete